MTSKTKPATAKPVTEAITETVTAPVATPKFLATIEPLVEGLEMTVEGVIEALISAKIIKGPTDKAANALASATAVRDEDFERAFFDALRTDLRLAVETLRNNASPTPIASVPTANASVIDQSQQAFNNILARPRERKGRSFLTGLSVESVAKVDDATVGVGIEVALAGQFRLFDVPRVLLEMMNEFVTNRMEEAAPPTYYELEREVARQDNSAVLAVLKVDPRFVTQASKHEFLARISNIWTPVLEFNKLLDGWVSTYNQAAGNPAAMMAAISAIGTGRRIAVVQAIPNTATLHGHAQLVTKAVNRAFAGRSIPAALALGYDAERITEYLTNPDIVRYTGCTNREELAQELTRRLGGNSVPTEFQSVEDALEQFILTVYNFERYAAKGSANEADVILSLWQIGQGLPWDRLRSATGKSSPNGTSPRRDDEPHPMGGRRNPFGG